MSKSKKILLADNIDSFRETCAEYFVLYGYHTTGVASPERCLSQIETDPPHLVILDVRMHDDNDEDDLSGLALARELPARLPKIILTAFPTWEAARAMLQVPEEGLPPASFFVSKLEGLEVLRRNVERAFAKHVLLNWELQVDWKSHDRNSLIRIIEPGLAESLLSNRAKELEDLLCRLFLNADKVEFDRVLWQQDGLVVLQIFVSSDGKTPEPLLVVCGQRDAVRVEATLYRQQARQAKQTSSPLRQAEMAETIHYAANCYTLGGKPHTSASSLKELYLVGLEQASAGLLIDSENQRAWVDGRLLKLTAQEFRLLRFLRERANQLCTRREIIEKFFNYHQYDKLDDSQDTLINTNISRLRTELEADPQNPRFLQTVRGLGYRLTVTD